MRGSFTIRCAQVQDDGEKQATATANAAGRGEKADPCGMTTRKAKATAKTEANADPCGMTTRKAKTTAKTEANADSYGMTTEKQKPIPMQGSLHFASR